MKKSVLLVLFLWLGLFSCTKKDAPSYRTEVVDGVRIVINRQISPDKEIKDLSLAVDLTIGAGEGETENMLYSPVDIDADPDGNMYILDMKDAWVKKYDPNGLFICHIGRKGMGPGEFERPNHIEIDSSNRIVVADPYQRRFEFLSRAGDYIKSVRMGPYVSSLACGRDGSILAGYGWREPDGTQEYRIGRLDEESGEIKDLFVQKQYWPGRLQNDQLRYDFPYFVRAAVDSQNRIIAGVAIEYEFSVLRRDGELEFKFNNAFERIPVKGEMLTQIVNMTLRGPNPYVNNPYFPVFESLSIDEEDKVWIQLYQPKWTGKTNAETRYDVFSPSGIFQFSTKIPGHINGPLEFKNGSIYALRIKESGFIEAVRFAY